MKEVNTFKERHRIISNIGILQVILDSAILDVNIKSSIAIVLPFITWAKTPLNLK